MWRRRSSSHSNDELVNILKAHKRVRSEEVEAVMRRVDRGRYCPRGTMPYHDAPQGIGYNATISAPHMHAMMLELLLPALKAGRRRRALDVGAGSGYLTACMALLQGAEGLVVGVEHIPELAAFAEDNVRRDQPRLLREGRVQFVVGDGRKGHPPEAPYDAIHVGAAASEKPKELEAQLAPGGIMVVPLGSNELQTLIVTTRSEDGQLRYHKKMAVTFVPLTDARRQWPLYKPPAHPHSPATWTPPLRLPAPPRAGSSRPLRRHLSFGSPHRSPAAPAALTPTSQLSDEQLTAVPTSSSSFSSDDDSIDSLPNRSDSGLVMRIQEPVIPAPPASTQRRVSIVSNNPLQPRDQPPTSAPGQRRGSVVSIQNNAAQGIQSGATGHSSEPRRTSLQLSDQASSSQRNNSRPATPPTAQRRGSIVSNQTPPQSEQQTQRRPTKKKKNASPSVDTS